MGYHECLRPQEGSFVFSSDLPNHATKVRGEVVDQFLVPLLFKSMVLNLAHNDSLGGHLGAEKTGTDNRQVWESLLK